MKATFHQPDPDVIYRRPWTLPHTSPRGNSISMVVKTACNSCGRLIGDMSDAEVVAAINGDPLPDVTAECPYCTPDGPA